MKTGIRFTVNSLNQPSQGIDIITAGAYPGSVCIIWYMPVVVKRCVVWTSLSQRKTVMIC